MPSPNHGRNASSTSAGRYSAAAIRRGELKISEPILLPEDATESSPCVDQDMTNPYHITIPVTDGARPQRSTPPGTTAGAVSEDGRWDTSQLALNRESTGHSMLLSTMSSKNSLKQRKSGGFRATIRSLFGSKRHRSSLSNDRSYHISDPGNLVSIREKRPERHVTRTSSQILPGVTQASPLGSHSPFTPLEGRTTGIADRIATLPGHRRRNTLPSIVFSDHDAQQIRNAVNDTDTKQAIDANHNEPCQMPKALKRRSRSADALAELVPSQIQSPSTWRQSLVDQPLPTFETTGGAGGRKMTTAASTARVSRLNSSVSLRSLKPVQNFDFGLLGNVSLEDRVNTLELKCVNFEYAIAGLQGYDVGAAVSTSRPPKRRSIHDLFVETNAPRSSRATSEQGPTFLRSPTDSSSFSDEDRRQTQRSSATTIRPFKANPSPPQRSAATSPSTIDRKDDQYGDLLAMLKEERVARKHLEAQVLELQKQVTAYAATHPGCYVAPSPESMYTEPNEHRARPLHRTPAFPRRSRHNLAETSRFSVSDTEESETEGGFHDVYETPQKNKYTFTSAEVSPRPTVEIF